MMEEIVASVVVKASSYFNTIDDLKGQSPSEFLVEFAIEKYKHLRQFPTSYTQEKIEKDIWDNLNTITMAVVDLYLKVGAEGETVHNENGVNITYEDAYISSSVFKNVYPFVSTVLY